MQNNSDQDQDQGDEIDDGTGRFFHSELVNWQQRDSAEYGMMATSTDMRSLRGVESRDFSIPQPYGLTFQAPEEYAQNNERIMTPGSWGYPYATEQLHPAYYEQGASMPRYYYNDANRPYFHSWQTFPVAAAGPPSQLAPNDSFRAGGAHPFSANAPHYSVVPNQLRSPVRPTQQPDFEGPKYSQSWSLGSNHVPAPTQYWIGSGNNISSSNSSSSNVQVHNHKRGKNRKSDNAPGGGGDRGFGDNMTLHHIKGRVVEMALEQEASRFIQQRLAIADISEIAAVFDEAMPSIDKLWNDVYGNFVLQGLLDYGSTEMKKAIAEEVKNSVVSVSTRVYGCRVVQKAFDNLDRNEVAEIVAKFKGKVMFCIHDHNGNHVIQKSIKALSAYAKGARRNGDHASCYFLLGSLDVIINEVVESIEDLSRHPYGCRVVQRTVEHCIEPQKSRALDKIIACHRSLIDDQYGNYVVQRALTYGRLSDRRTIFETIITDNNVWRLSRRKQASNVIEAMLKNGSPYQRRQIVEEMLKVVDGNKKNTEQTSAVVLMATNAYANYVVKTALDVVEDSDLREQLYFVLRSNLAHLNDFPFAKHIVTKVKANKGTENI